MTGGSDIEQLKARMVAWRADPVRFVKDVFQAEPTNQQARVMRAFAAPGAKVAVKSGHGVGKSALMAWLGIWHTLLFSDAKAAATAPSATQLRDVLMAEVGKWVHQAHPWVSDQLNVSTMRLSLKGRDKTQFMTARTARPEEPSALQGLHAGHMAFFIDEAFGVADAIFTVARGSLSTPEARVILCGNPTANSGYAYNAFHRNRDLWRRFTLSCEDSRLVDKQYIADMRSEYGEDADMYKVRVLGRFGSAAVCQLISTSSVDAALGKHLQQHAYRFAPVILGVDVSWFGDDRSAVFLRQGLRSELLGSWYNIDTMRLAGLVAQFEDRHKASAVFVDATGVGAGVVDRLRQLGRSPLGVHFASRPGDSAYHNKRAECWGLMRDWLSDGGILPDNDDLREELISLEYGYSPSGKILLERKEDLKKRGRPSPDLADALALTFAAPVAGPLTDVLPIHRPRRAQTEYDLFEYDLFEYDLSD